MQDNLNVTKKPVLYLHIGAPKTATTFLQNCIAENLTFLMKNRICYPAGQAELYAITHAITHQHFFVSITQEFCKEMGAPFNVRDYGLASVKQPREIVEEMKCALAESHCDKMIISCELFFRAVEVGVLDHSFPLHTALELRKYILLYCKKAFSEFDIKVVCYLRRQDNFMESIFNQDIKQIDWEKYDNIFVNPLKFKIGKCEFKASEEEFDPLLAKYINNHSYWLEYYDNLSEWAIIYGKENLIVRPFEKVQMPNGIEYDFFVNVLGFDEEFFSNLSFGDKLNESVNTDIIGYKMATGLYEIREGFTWLNWRSHLLNLIPGNKKNLMTAKQAERLMNYCEEDNEKIAREYLKRESGIMFYDKPREEKEDYLGLSLETVLNVSKEMILQLYHNIIWLQPSLYIDYGNGFNNIDRILIYTFNKEQGFFDFVFQIPPKKQKGIVGLRFDPDESHVLEVRLDSVLIDGHPQTLVPENATVKAGDYDIFLTLDPIYLFSSSVPAVCKEVHISGIIRPVSAGAQLFLANEIAALRSEVIVIKSESETFATENERLSAQIDVAIETAQTKTWECFEISEQIIGIEKAMGALMQENDELNAQVEYYKNSFSFRITRPFRVVRQIFRSVFNK